MRHRVHIQPPRHPGRVVARLPGDKSISHRAVLFAAVAQGTSRIHGALDTGDVGHSVAVARALGARVTRDGAHLVVVGTDKNAPVDVDCGRSGTTLRLTTGLLVGRATPGRLRADPQLLARPMDRVVEPLRVLGGALDWRADGMHLDAHRGLRPATIAPSVASAQVKGAVLLAGVLGGVPVTVDECAPTRDHTERLLRAMGVDVVRTDRRVRAVAPGPLRAVDVDVPGDPSSAAALATAAALLDGATVEMPGVCLNPGRTGFFDVLKRMGAAVTRRGLVTDIEPRADIVVEGGPRLRATDVGPDEIPALVDEVMLVGLLATQADGVTRLRGLSELRVKESDRVAEMARVLRAFGATIDVAGDDVTISGQTPLRATTVNAGRDHRVAMLASLAALCGDGRSTIEGADYIADSFPRFGEVLAAWGALC